MKKRILSVAATVGVLSLVAGCSGGGNSAGGGGEAGTPAENATFTIALQNDFGGMNPYLERQNFGYGVSSYLYDSLVNISTSGEITSGIAESWETTPEQIIFNLRDDVTCSSGEAITASYVAELIEWNSDSANGSSMYSVYTSNVPTTAVGDDATGKVTVDFGTPDGLGIERLGMLPIVCSEGFKNPAMLATASDGTGPYVLESAQAGDQYTMVRRDGYAWGPDGIGNTEPGMPEKVVFRIVSDESTRANLLLSGEVNVAKVVGPDRDRLDGQKIPYFDQTVGGTWLNISQDPNRVTSDKDVRTAMFEAISFDEVIQISTAGRGSMATSMTVLAPQVCAAQDPIGPLVPQYDPEAAAKTLDAAGWVVGSDGIREKDGKRLKISLPYNPADSPENTPTAEYFADKWGSVGIGVELRALDSVAMYDVLLKTSDFDVQMGASAFFLPSAQIRFWSGPMPPNGMNSANHQNPEYEKNTQIALGMTPPEACEYWIKAERAFVDNLEYVPISNRVDGWYFNDSEGDVAAYSKIVPSTVRVFQ